MTKQSTTPIKPNQKRCSKCGAVKELGEFQFRNKKKGTYKPRCKECTIKDNKIYRENNKDQINEWNKTYRKNNPKKIKASSKKWRDANPEKIKEKNRKWSKGNPEKINEKTEKWRKNNPKKYKESYIKSNKKWKNNNPKQQKEIDTKYRENNREQIKENHIRWCESNPERNNKHKIKWAKTNPKKVKESHNKHYQAERLKQILDYTPADFPHDQTIKNPTHLYIVKHNILPIFKIGITTLLDRRLNDISRDFGESTRLHYVTVSQCRLLESYLHIKYDHLNYKGFTKEHGGGYKEWFHDDCLEEVLEKLQHNE